MKQIIFFVGGFLLLILIVVGQENFVTALLVILGVIVCAIIIGVANNKKAEDERFKQSALRSAQRKDRLDQQKAELGETFKVDFPPAGEDQYPRYIFMDFETSDLPVNYSMPTEEFMNVYPFIVQAAVLVFNEKHELIDQFSSIIRAPEYARFAPKAVEIHGITKSRSLTEGIHIDNLFTFFKKHITGSAVLIAHNIKFDNFILKLECKRNRIRLPKIQTYCTMLETVGLCKIEKQYGSGGYKWPNLKELVFHTYTDGQTVDLNFKLHDAYTDIKLCAMCFFKLKLYKNIEKEIS